MFWRLACGCLMSWVCLAATIQARAQGPSGASAPIRFSRLGSPSGANQYTSESWGVVGVDVVNSQAEPAEVLAAFGFSRDPDLQFARRIRIPAHAVRRTWVPVKLPRLPPSRESIECFGLLIDDRSGREVVLRPDYEGVQHSTTLRVNQDRPVTGAFVADADEDAGEVDYAYEAVIALRTARGYQRGLAWIQDRDLPALHHVFDGLDQIVLWDDRFASDVAILSALRAWLNDGGQLWIMLDRVDFDGVERLLGETFTCQLVNRVAWHEVTIQDVAPPPGTAPPSTQQYEEPQDFARVLVNGMRVTHTVQGWPAAFWRP